MLTLPIKRKWFNSIMSGEKKEEYRYLSRYYSSRLERYVGKSIFLKLRNGYSASSPYIIVQVFIRKGLPNQMKGEEWGADISKIYYVLEIKEIIE